MCVALVSYKIASYLSNVLAASEPNGEPKHPLMTLYEQAWPGGMWTSAYTADTSGRVAYIMSTAPRLASSVLLLLLIFTLIFLYFGVAVMFAVVFLGVSLWGIGRRSCRSRKNHKSK